MTNDTLFGALEHSLGTHIGGLNNFERWNLFGRCFGS